MDPVNMIIPGLIRVADGDIEGVPAGDYPLEKIGGAGFAGNGDFNTHSLIYNSITLSLSENIKTIDDMGVSTLFELQSLLLPSTLGIGNIEENFGNLGYGGKTVTDPNLGPDGPVNTGLGTQPIPVIPPPTPITQGGLLSLYYPLTMPYYLNLNKQ